MDGLAPPPPTPTQQAPEVHVFVGTRFITKWISDTVPTMKLQNHSQFCNS